MINDCIAHSNTGVWAEVFIYNSHDHIVIIQNTLFSNNHGGVSVDISVSHSKLSFWIGVKYLHNSGTWHGGASLLHILDLLILSLYKVYTFIESNNSSLKLDLSRNDTLWSLIKYTTFLINFEVDW